MSKPRLTNCAGSACGPATTGRQRGGFAVMSMMGKGALLLSLAGCITLEAPDEPIVIELNINITQEVIYRLAEDAGNTIDENASIF